LAAEYGHNLVAELLIDSRADVTGTDKHGRTPLHIACARGHEKVARLLIDKGADISVVDRDRSDWTGPQTGSLGLDGLGLDRSKQGSIYQFQSRSKN